MTNQTNTRMSLPPDEQWEEDVRQTASALPYPSTPNVTERVIAQIATERGIPSVARRAPVYRLQPVWVVSIILAMVIGLLAVPPVRAAILEFLQIGAVRIWQIEPTPMPTLIPVSSSSPSPTPTPLSSFLELAGETTLAKAEAEAGFPIRLPTYPSDLGLPDKVFYQELGGPIVVLVWLNPDQPDEAQYSLHILGEGAIVDKGNPPTLVTTTVHGLMAAWTSGPYLLVYRQGSGTETGTRMETEMLHIVSGRVLIWYEDRLTYRLESNSSLEETVRMAESLQ